MTHSPAFWLIVIGVGVLVGVVLALIVKLFKSKPKDLS